MRQRGAGILIHISSLPSRFGIGDIGPASYRFVDFLADSNLHYWQILPLNPTDPKYDNSPYHCLSAFGTNPLFISLEKMIQDGFLDINDIKSIPDFDQTTVEYEKVINYKTDLFNQAYERFKEKIDPAFYTFCQDNAWWLDDFSLFSALKNYYSPLSWTQWPDNLKWRRPEAIERIKLELSNLIEKEKFFQYLFINQWNALKSYCREHDVLIIGDLPIYVNYDSVDVWTNPQMFNLDDSMIPITVSGVPPDYFSITGQLWGDPVYNWEYLKKSGYSWWIKRFERNIGFVDFLRVDHFRGLVAFWEVPFGEKNAINGRWREVPIEDFLEHLTYKIPILPVIAEDLGIITPDVREIMRKYQIPGMKVLLFAFTQDIGKNPYILHNHEKDCIIYTGTHDNNPILGWYHNELNQEDKTRLFSYIGNEIPESELPWTLIRLVMMSVANTVIIPMQDILCLDSGARMNHPAKNVNNWRWRATEDYLRDDIIEALNKMVRLYGRG